MKKPRLFIGSSSRNLNVARAVQNNLDDDAEVTIWNQGIFEPSSTALESLLSALEGFHVGVFVFAPDDIARIKGEDVQTVRDNVIFELGLFIGRIGKERSFILMPRGVDNFRIPSDLAGLTILGYDAHRSDGNMTAATAPACNKIRDKLSQSGPFSPGTLPSGLGLVRRDEFTRVLFERLHDPKVNTVRLITYTAEVDHWFITPFHVKGHKDIHVYKRSILSDLAEEQEHNIEMLASQESCPYNKAETWNKKPISTKVSDELSSAAAQGLSITQHLYHAPPSRRVYAFDKDEAVVAYYEVMSDVSHGPGSLYKGMSDELALHVTRGSPLADYLLKEIHSYFDSLERSCRPWDEERRILYERAPWTRYGKRPCIGPRIVLLDLDGILFDSLPLYLIAWQEAFQSVGLEFPPERVYLEEGRSGRETVLRYLRELQFQGNIDETVDTVLNKKAETLARLGQPKPMAGATDLVRTISRSKIDMMVVTGSSNKQHIAHLAASFPGLLAEDAVITGENVKAGKPHPDPYLLACLLKGIHPHEALVIENSPLGIESATVAGTFCTAVNTGPLPNTLLKSAGARAVFKSCNALAERWYDILQVLG